MILRGNKETKGAGNRRNTEGKKVVNNVFSVEDFFFPGVETQETFFFFFNTYYEEDFSQHCEELREEGDDLTKVFVPRWSHCMLINKNLVCCGYPI